MENKEPQQNGSLGVSETDTHQVTVTPSDGVLRTSTGSRLRKARSRWGILRIAVFALLALLFIGGGVYALKLRNDAEANKASLQPSDNFGVQNISLKGINGGDATSFNTLQSLSINGQLRANNSLVLAPTSQPKEATQGQIYYDKDGNVFAYYDGQEFVNVANNKDVTALQDQITSLQNQAKGLQGGLDALPTDIATQSGNNTFTGSNQFQSSVSLLGGANTSSLKVSGSTVLQSALTVNGAATLSNNLIVGGSTTLGATTASSLVLSSPLDVGSGGTGTNSFTTNGILLGQGASPVTTVTAGAAGLCLVSTAGAPAFQACPGGGGSSVDSVNGLTGALSIANASGSGTIITIDDASTAAKGIASFSATNFSVSSGAVSISAGGVGSTELANNAVTTLKVNDGAITNIKLANSSLTVTAGTGLTGGGSVALGGSTTLNLANTAVTAGAYGSSSQVATFTVDAQGRLIAASSTNIAISGGQITSGTIADGRLSSNVAKYNDATANFTGALQRNGNDVCTVAGNCAGVGGTGDILQGGNSFGATMSIGTNDAQSLILETSNTPRLTITSAGAATFSSSVAASSFSGDGSALTNLNATQLTSGTIDTARISGSYTGITGVGTIAAGTWQGGAIADAYLQDNITISSAGTVDWTALNNYPAACAAGNAITALGDTITCSAFAASSGSGSYIQNTVGNQNSANFNIQSASTSSVTAKLRAIAGQTADIIQVRDSGDTSTVFAVTPSGAVTATSFSGDGASLSNLNASNISSGTLNIARIADGSVTNTKLTNSTLTVSAGSGLGGGGLVALGGSTSLSVNYGNAAGTAVQGNVQLVCPTGSGNLSGGGNTITLGDGGSCGNLSFANSPVFSGTVTIQGGVATLGASGQQGSAVLYDGGVGGAANTGTIQVIGSLGQNTSYILPDPGVSSATICLSTGNCAGTGGGVTSPGGNNGKIAKFTGANTIADSTLSESGSTLTATGNLVIQGANSLTLGTSSSFDGSIRFNNASGGNYVALQAPVTNPGSNLTFTLPSAYGSNGDCLQSNGSGGLTFTSCTGGAGGGVTSIDGLTGVVTISNATGSAGNIVIDDATTAAKGIASFSASNFGVTSGAVSIKAGGVSATELATDAVTTTKIADSNVTNAKLQNSSLTVTAGNGLVNGGSVSLGGSTTLNIASANGGIVVNADNLALTLQPSGDGLSSTTSSGSGLEILSGGFSLLQGCADGEILKWNEATDTWGCAADAGGSGLGDNISVNGSGAADANFIDTVASGTATGVTWALNTTPSPDEISISIANASATQAGSVTTGVQTFAGTKTFNGQIVAGAGIDLGTQTLQGTTSAIDFSNFDVLANGNTTVGGTLAVTGTSTFNGDVTVAAGKSLTLTGGNTASRPASPTAGMLYYDTTTNQMLQYNGSKWVGDRSGVTKTVAPSNASQAIKDSADYVATGSSDQATINTALTAASGGRVYLFEGTFTTDDAISIPNNTTLSGSGSGTFIQFSNINTLTRNMITNTDTSTGTGITIRDLRLDGLKATNTTGTQRGINLNGMGAGTGSSARQGAFITGVVLTSFRSENIYLTASSNNKITNVTSQDSGSEGIQLTSTSSNNVITGSKFQGNAGNGFLANGSSAGNTISGNNAQGNAAAGFSLASSTNNTLSANTANGNSSYGFTVSAGATNNSVSGNATQGNTSGGFNITGTNNTFTGNSTSGGTYGFNVNGTNNTVTGNTATSNTQAILLNSDHSNITGNTINSASTYGIWINSGNFNTVASNRIYDSGGAAQNNGIFAQTADSNSITDNYITDTSATTNNYAINISNSASDINYLSGNVLASGTINDSGTGTIFNGQVKDASNGNYYIQSAGTVELMKNTNVTGTLNVSSNVDTNGSLTVGNADQFVISNTGVVTSGTWQGGTVGVAYGGTGNTTYTTNGSIYYDGTKLTSTAAGTTGQCLLATTGSAPSWGTCTGAGGVSSIQGGTSGSAISGALTLSNSTTSGSTITLDTATTAAKGIASFSASNFTVTAGAVTIKTGGVGSTEILDGSVSNADLTNSSLTVTAGNGLVNGGSVSLGGSTTLNIASANGGIVVNADNIALTLQPSGDALSATTSSGSGLEILSGGFSLLQGCADNQILKWNETTDVWACGDDAGGSGLGDDVYVGGVSATNANFANTTVSGTVAGITWNLNTAPSPDDITLTVSTASATDAGIVTNTTQTFGGAKTFNGQIVAGAGINLGAQTLQGTSAVIDFTNFDVLANGNTTVGGGLTVTGTSTLNDNVTVAANKTLTLTGGTTATRNGLTPAEGMMYYDTTTKQLVTYSNGKWQGDRSDAIYVAASNSSQADKDRADYVGDGDTVAAGDGDQVQINSALTAASGKKVVLLAGTYTIDASISIPNNTTLAGVGAGTLITVPNAQNGSYNAVTNTTTGGNGTGIAIQDLRLDGNKANQTSGAMKGIFLFGVGSGTGSSAIQGAKVTNVQSNNWYGSTGAGILVQASSNSTFTSNTTQGNDGYGISISSSSSNNTFTGNTTQGNGQSGFNIDASSNNTFTGNNTQGNGQHGITNTNGSNSNTFTGNTMQGNGQSGILIQSSSNNTITSNNIQGSTFYGIFLSGSSNNIIDGNKIHDSNGSTNNDGIRIIGASASNQVTNNNITDTACTTTCYAITLTSTSVSLTYLSGNTYSGSTANAASINDAGTGTMYAGQADGSGNLINKSQGGGFTVGAGTASATLTLQGGLLSSQLPTPAAPSTVVTGATGTSYSYAVAALDGTGTTLASTPTAASAASTLNGSNYVTVNWAAVPGAVQYKVYRTASAGTPSSTGLIGTVNGNVLTFNDTGIAATTAVPASNTTGGATIAGAIQGSSLTLTTALAVTSGGTGQSSVSVGDILVGAAGNTFNKLAIGSNGACLTSNGTTASWGTCTATTLQGTYNATTASDNDTTGYTAAEMLLANSKSLRIIAADTATDPSIIMKLNCTSCTNNTTTGAFLIQNSSAAALFSVAGNGTIEIGTHDNGIYLSGSGGSSNGAFLLKGTARNTKYIRLHAEYPSVVLTADGSNNLGTITSAYDNSNSTNLGGAARMSYYNWTTTQGTNQDYDIVVQVPIPADFDGWNTNPLSIAGYTSNTTNGTISLEARDSANTQICNFVSVTPGSANDWFLNNTACTLSSGTYTPGDYMTLRIRLQAPTSGNTRVGNIVLSYKSKF